MSTPHSGDVTSTEARTPPVRRLVSSWVLVALLVGTAGVCLSAYGNLDPDVYWHRVLGELWLTQGGLDLDPDPIAFTEGRDWFPTAWLVEVLYTTVVEALGYAGIFALRLLLAVVFYGLLARFLFSATRPPIATLVLAGVGLPTCFALQDRPQTFSLLFCTALLPALNRALRLDVLPRWWAVLLVTWVWANVHGLWVLVPGLLVILTLARVLERQRSWRESAVLALAAIGVAALTPVGPRLIASPLLVGNATSAISEWSPTALRNPAAWNLAFCLAVLLTCGLAGYRSDRRHIVYVLCITAFAFWAYRNAAFASLLLTPVVAEAAAVILASRHLESTKIPRAMVIACLPVLGAASVATYLLHAGVPDELPHRIADRLGSSGADVRVVNDYNVSGFLREFGGDHVRLAIDGRADRYGEMRIQKHGELLQGRRGWRRDLAALRPDAVVIASDSALRELLVHEGWRATVVDGEYVLLVRT